MNTLIPRFKNLSEATAQYSLVQPSIAKYSQYPNPTRNLNFLVKPDPNPTRSQKALLVRAWLGDCKT